jgi:hypothetical protein
MSRVYEINVSNFSIFNFLQDDASPTNCINLDNQVDDEIKRHRVIRIGSCKFLSLCCFNYWTRLWCFQLTCCPCLS